MDPITSSEDRQIKAASLDSLDEYQISLLEEKLQVARRKEKVGEVIIRKQVETRIVRLPIRREKLVIEKIGEHPEKLAEVVINEEKVNGYKYDELNDRNDLDLNQSKFVSLSTARELLSVLAELPSTARVKVRLDIATNGSEDKLIGLKIKDICDRY